MPNGSAQALPRPLIPRVAGWRRAMGNTWEVLQHDRFALAGACLYALFIAVALAAPLLSPYDPQQTVMQGDQLMANQPPGRTFLLGTTNVGRDIFTQLVYGARPALTVGFVAAFFVALIGTVAGIVAGFYGGWIDAVLMRLADVAFGIPFLPLVIVLVAFLGPSLWNIVLTMALLLWKDTARVVRAQVLTLRERGFVEAARVLGSSPRRLMLVHIAPNVLPIALLYGSLAVGWAILTEAAVSFLGFGDPSRISWGYMLQDAYISQALSSGQFNWFVPPGICIMLVVMAGYFISRGYEELLFPRLRRQ
ncbi:MAG TPA: ABC transporter permease [bacterium]|nr:ABC transporter permease [bacterium]